VAEHREQLKFHNGSWTEWTIRCTCGWTSPRLSSEYAAEEALDQHIAAMQQEGPQ
jgi:hypothetical protein